MFSRIDRQKSVAYATERTFFAFSCPTMNWFRYSTSYIHSRLSLNFLTTAAYLTRSGESHTWEMTILVAIFVELSGFNCRLGADVTGD